MHKLCNYIDDELMELERKADKNGKLSNSEIEYGKNLAKFKMALLTNERMEDDDYSETGRYHESYNPRRDSMGRYSRDGFMDELHKLMEKAPDDKHKRAIRRMIEDME